MTKSLSSVKNKNSTFERNKNLILKKCSHWLQCAPWFDRDCGNIITSICGIMILPDEFLDKTHDSYIAPLTLNEFIVFIQFLDDFPQDVQQMTLERLNSRQNCYWNSLYENWNELFDMYKILFNTPDADYENKKKRENALEKRLLQVLCIDYIKINEE